MGGAGKTTLARAVFDKISIQFEGKSFIGNVREVANNPLTGLKSLQQQILSEVLNDKDIRLIGHGKNIMKQRMRGRKVLIALDDVNDIEQLEALAGEPDWFKSGSRIIITTRDERVLLAHKVTLIRDVNMLSNKEAICLFSRNAFGSDGPIKGYEELSKQVLSYAAGLPLTIKVLGSQLFGKDKPEWEDALLRLKTIPLAKTLEILELSYTALEGDLKEIFLDVACIMKGWRKNDAIKVLESCGFYAKFGLRVLQQKSLLNIDHNQCLGMHDHIEEMGINIVRRSHNKPHKHSGLWKRDEIEHILANDLGTKETKCLYFKPSWAFDPDVIIKGLGKMKELRFLSVTFSSGSYSRNLELNTWSLNPWSPSFPDFLGYLFLDYYPFKSLPKRSSPGFLDALKYMNFHNYPLRTLPKMFQAKNLVSLEMPNSQVEQLWVGDEHKVLHKLRFLDLSHSKLRILDLRWAPNLETLNLIGCRDLAEFPDGMCMLKHLRSLNLACMLLEKLPEDLGHLKCLEGLHLASTKIKHIPDSICKLKHLKSLKLWGCELLEKLHENLGHLECLEHLDFSYTQIKHLPDSICMLKHLISLCLYGRKLLEKLPEDLGHIECIEQLSLTDSEIKHLPDSICMLKHLKSLHLYGCKLLEKLPDDLGHLECLEELYLPFTKIKHLPDSICMLKHLKSLTLFGCNLLEKLPEDLGHIECLEHLNLKNTKIKHLPDSICMLKYLISLHLSDCELLEKLPEDLGRLECLKHLYLECKSISHIPQSILLLKGLRIYGSREFLQSLGFTSETISFRDMTYCVEL